MSSPFFDVAVEHVSRLLRFADCGTGKLVLSFVSRLFDAKWCDKDERRDAEMLKYRLFCFALLAERGTDEVLYRRST